MAPDKEADDSRGECQGGASEDLEVLLDRLSSRPHVTVATGLLGTVRDSHNGRTSMTLFYKETVKVRLNNITPLLDVSRPIGGNEVITASRADHRAIGSE